MKVIVVMENTPLVNVIQILLPVHPKSLDKEQVVVENTNLVFVSQNINMTLIIVLIRNQQQEMNAKGNIPNVFAQPVLMKESLAAKNIIRHLAIMYAKLLMRMPALKDRIILLFMAV